MVFKLSVDRIESGIAVCYDDNDKKYELRTGGLSEGDIIEAEFDENGTFLSHKVLTEETKRKKNELSLRTKKLFNRNKN